MTCHTANGPVEISEGIAVELADLGACTLKADLVEDSPPLLGVGGLCMCEGFSFYRDSGQEPHLVTPNGKHLWLDLQGAYVPHLNSKPQVMNKVNELEACRSA